VVPGRRRVRSWIGKLHHVEIWVPDLAQAVTQWGWLLESLGYSVFQDWPAGRSWRLGGDLPGRRAVTGCWPMSILKRFGGNSTICRASPPCR